MSDCRVPMPEINIEGKIPRFGKRECGICDYQAHIVCLAEDDDEFSHKLDQYILDHGWKIDLDNNRYICPNCQEEGRIYKLEEIK